MADPRSRLPHHEQMADAQAGCVPCKLCGGQAVISDAGTGAGYYIKCSGTRNWRASTGCMIDMRRLGGWAYNVRDWWNRLHSTDTTDGATGGGEVQGAFACPICGEDKPHHHTPAVVDAYQNKRSRT